MIQQAPLSDAMELLFRRADELQQRRSATSLVPQPVTPARLLHCSNCGKQTKALQRNRRCAGCANVTASRFQAAVRANRAKRRAAAWEPPPCCTRCSGPGPLSKRLKLCQECLHRHKEQQQQKHRVYRLVSTPKDYRMELTYDEVIPKGRCPTCGIGIDPDLPACAKHMTIVLLKRMRTCAVEV